MTIKPVILGQRAARPRGRAEDPASGTPGAAGFSGSTFGRPENDGGIFFRPNPLGLSVQVAGAWLTLLPSGAAFIAAERTLICADLHLEKGSAYAARGQMLPPYDTRETLRRLALDVARLGPERVVLLGDTLHDGGAEARIGDEDALTLARLASGRRLIWIVGNHDPGGRGGLPGETAETLAVGSLSLRHEPLAGAQPGELAGHLHPCARVKARAGAVRRRCFVTDGLRMILPAYGAYAGGLSVLDRAFEGLFVRQPLVGALGARRVHAIGWPSVRAD